MSMFFAFESSDPPPDARAERIRFDIAARLRGICHNFTDEEFSALIDKMTSVQLRGERRTL